MSARTIIIPDVHGCLDELRDLFDKLQVSSSDRLVFLGDLIDRGPHPGRTVRFVRTLPNEKLLCLGNHEERFLRFLKHERAIEAGEYDSNPMQDIDDLYALASVLEKKDLDFLYSAKLFHQLTIGGRDYIALHGGIGPKTKSLEPMNSRTANELLRLRTHDPDGNFTRLGDETESSRFWAQDYDGRFGFAIHGHTDFRDRQEPPIWNNAISLDLGCVYGGTLAAVIIDEKGFLWIDSVPSRKNYAGPRPSC